MKRTFLVGGAAVAMALATLGGVTSSAGATGDDEPITIAWISPDATTSARWETQDKPAFEAAVHELAPNAEILFSFASTDEEMLQQAESAVTQGAQVIVINPITAEGSLPVVDLAGREDIPVIAYEGLIAGAPLDGYITFNNLEVGRLQAQYIVDHVEPGSTIAVMNGAQVCAACIDFKVGAHEVFDPLVESGDLVIGYEADTPDWLSENAQTQTEQALTDLDDDVQAILAANDGLAQGVIAALKARQLNGQVVVTGQDATLAGLQEILLGNQTMTVYKDLKQQAGAAAEAAVALARGEEVTNLTDTFDNGGHDVPALFLDPTVIDIDNIERVVDDGFVTREDLCIGDAADACDF
jgi:D-xylose transport system substrate-binding protein